MLAEIYIISGFLGAGKTTLIEKLLKETFHNEKIVLIENDFGDVSVDSILLKSSGIEIKEINSGCICCSLSGDFVKSLLEVLDRFHPDKIIIEPSGVGKLSDIINACGDPRILSHAKIKTKITIVDVKRCKMYLDNFGEFFEDQIQNADTIFLSKTEEFPDKIQDAVRIIRKLNPHAFICQKPWTQIDMNEIHPPQTVHVEPDNTFPGWEWNFEQRHGNGYHCTHEHDCLAEEVFDTVTIQTNRIFSPDELRMQVSRMEKLANGTILRAKGIVRGPNGYINLQYLPADIKITECTSKGNMLCIIGRNLNKKELYSFFNGE